MRRRYRYDSDMQCMVEIRPGSNFFEAPHPCFNAEIPTPMHMIDCYHRNPVQSPVDLTALDSRSAVREHNRRNDVIDIGNDRGADVPKRDFYADIPADVKTAHDKIEQNHPESLAIIEAGKTKPTQDLSDARII